MKVAMRACPFCGSLLTESLVNAIVNPSMDESCPSQPEVAPAPDASKQLVRGLLATYMLLGRMVSA